jgi:hypothetical protein
MEAHLALNVGEKDRAYDLFRQAAQAERRALDRLDVAKARTRGITAVSAVALWFKAEDYDQAEQLAYSMLGDPNIPEFARADLRNLVQAIWTEAAKRAAGVTFVPGQVLVSVKGGEVVTGGAPLELIVDKMQTIQSMFFRTVEYVQGVSHRTEATPSREIQESCRPWLFQSSPGSHQFSVAIQKPMQADFFREDVEPERIAQHFLEIVRASAADDAAALENLVPDKSYRSTFLQLARKLAPTGKTFDQIEFRTTGDDTPVCLGVESRGNIKKNLRSMSPPQAKVADVSYELRGTLRAVHLDQDWLEIVVDDVPTRVEGLQDTVDDVIGPMVNRLVVVKTTRNPQNKMRFVDIEIID